MASAESENLLLEKMCFCSLPANEAYLKKKCSYPKAILTPFLCVENSVPNSQERKIKPLRKITFSGHILIIETAKLQWMCYSGPYIKWLIALCRACGRRNFINKFRLLLKLLYHLNNMIQKTWWYLSCQWKLGMHFGALGRPLRSMMKEKASNTIYRQLFSF